MTQDVQNQHCHQQLQHQFATQDQMTQDAPNLHQHQLTNPSPSTPAPPLCYPGSNDPRCPKPTLPPTTPTPVCYPGSTDPRCPQITPVQTPFVCVCNNSTPKPIPPPLCYPGSTDPRCPTKESLVCYPGSPDPRCPQFPLSNSLSTYVLTPLEPVNEQGNNKFIQEVTTQYPSYISTDDSFGGQQQLDLFNKALNGFNIQRRDVESGIRNLKSELKNEIGNENLDALDSLGDDVLRELQNEQESQKKR
ncbi:unnamed protein product [Macrosiphum euphorbiae]|uniref:Uncharacterized protein n=1 Tax=Macrosiphum euphorbiae TaxID=13131 RepID=A0AAV0XFL2_9HEMI|nr:unnamed protein product [Macrosiphum euphorbiae]